MSNWVLRGYDRTTERMVHEYSLSPPDPQMLRQLFQRPKDDPLFDSFPVSAPALKVLAQQYRLTPLADDLDYFVEYAGTDIAS